ncbi:HEAT repeat domain-containing protein [Candidatus Laterigemmans baculatus]|uniref:HEAT repeat domain-containing protein n=1 Tax=Candidatus Laterigemmans baculatus TaxID=2770505 RepID=UPI0013D9206E|nr:HEAT repeat domain-containing protein [Candidatus Laterigemmans baculatus]
MTGPSDDNPFILPPPTPRAWPRWRLGDRKPRGRWFRAVAALALCSFGVFGAHQLAQQWLISRLADNLEAHPPHVQIERIAMLSEFGAAGVPKIVAALGSPDDTVSATAFQVLRDLQGRWQTSDSDDAVGCQQTLLESLRELADHCPPERRPRVAELVNQLVLDTVGTENQAEAEIYREACELLAVVSQSPAIADAPATATEPHTSSDLDSSATRLAALASAEMGSTPPPAADPSGRDRSPQLLTPLPPAASVRIVSGPTAIGSGQAEPAASSDTAPPPADREDAPRQVDSDQMPRLAPLSQSSFIVTPVEPEEPMLGGNPLAAYDTRSVIDFIGSAQPTLREAAEAELRKRDFTAADLELATRLTSTSAEVRLAMVNELPERADVDPRMWLIWLAADPERDVRLQAIARLGTMDDREVHEALRDRLREERDPTVATRLRRFLGLR